MIEQKFITEEALKIAEEAFKKGELELALNNLNQIISHDPNNTNAFYLLSQIYFAKTDYLKAFEYLVKVLSDTSFHSNIAVAHIGKCIAAY